MKEQENLDNYLNELFSGTESKGSDWNDFEKFKSRKRRRRFAYFLIPFLLITVIYAGSKLYSSTEQAYESAQQAELLNEPSTLSSSQTTINEPEQTITAFNTPAIVAQPEKENASITTSHVKDLNLKEDLNSSTRRTINTSPSAGNDSNTESNFEKKNAETNLTGQDLSASVALSSSVEVKAQEDKEKPGGLTVIEDLDKNNNTLSSNINSSQSLDRNVSEADRINTSQSQSEFKKASSVPKILATEVDQNISTISDDENSNSNTSILAEELNFDEDLIVSDGNAEIEEVEVDEKNTEPNQMAINDYNTNIDELQLDSPKLVRNPWSLGFVFQTGLSNFSSEKVGEQTPVHRDFENVISSSAKNGLASKIGFRLKYKSIGGLGINSGFSLSRTSNQYIYEYSITDIPVWDAVQLEMNYLDNPNKTEIRENSTFTKTSISIPLELSIGKKLSEKYKLIGLLGGEVSVLLDQSGKMINPFNLSLLDIDKENSRPNSTSVLVGIGIERKMKEFSVSLMPVFERQFGTVLHVELPSTARDINYIPYSIGLRLTVTKNNISLRK